MRTIRCEECSFQYTASNSDVAEKIRIQKQKHKEKTGHTMKEVKQKNGDSRGV